MGATALIERAKNERFLCDPQHAQLTNGICRAFVTRDLSHPVPGMTRVARVVDGRTVAFELHDDGASGRAIAELVRRWMGHEPDALLLCAPATYNDKDEAEQSLWWAEAMLALAKLGVRTHSVVCINMCV